MGQSLALGITTKIVIRKKKGYETEDINYALKDLKKIINIDDYKVKEKDEEGIRLILKEEIFDNNIHDFLKEIEPLTSGKSMFLFNLIDEDRNIELNKDFSKENYPIKLKWYDKNDKYKNEHEKNELCGECAAIYKDNRLMQEYMPFFNFAWLSTDYKVRSEFEIDLEFIPVWINGFKIISEDETMMLRIMNNLKTKYYQTKLSKDMIYYISG